MHKWINRYARLPLVFAIISLFSLVACSSNSGDTQPTATPTAVHVNGFGTASNHVHSVLVPASHVLVLATHYGLFRSEDGGTSWKEVAGGSNQLMDGLMTYSLSQSPLNPQRLYVLSIPVTSAHQGKPGLYTSSDQGRTWQLSIESASITASSIYLAQAGNDNPDEVYIYLSELGALGLKVSLDDGQHFSTTGTLPFGRILGLLTVPDKAGEIFVYGNEGIARSLDGGVHWQIAKGTTGGIFELTSAGSQGPLYASGDAGIYASTDGGTTFQLVSSQAAYKSLTVSPAKPQLIYGKTGVGVFRSLDGGHTWTALPHIAGNLQRLIVDPDNASQVYLTLDYPAAVYQLDPTDTAWLSLTPKP